MLPANTRLKFGCNRVGFYCMILIDFVFPLAIDSSQKDDSQIQYEPGDNMKQDKPIVKRDLLLIAGLLLVAAACFAIWQLTHTQAGNLVVVTVDGEEYAALPLWEDTQLLITDQEGETNLLVIQDGYADITQASCKNQVCVNSLPISKEGEMIVCLPHKVVVTIESEK